MPLYPRFWPGCNGVMLGRNISWDDLRCPPCGQPHTTCCRPTAADDERRICQCGELSILSPITLDGTQDPYQTISHVKLPHLIRLLPRNWQAALARATYCASPAELNRLERKSRRMLRRLERLAELAQAGNEKANAKGKKLYRRYESLQAVRHIYRAQAKRPP